MYWAMTRVVGLMDLVYDSGHDPFDAIQETSRHNIALLPAGRPRVGRPMPIGAARVGDLYRQLCARFDYVVVQQGSIIADTRYLVCAAKADLILMLVEEGVTPVDELDRSLDVFRGHQISGLRLVTLRATLNPAGAGADYAGPGLLPQATLVLLFAGTTAGGLITLTMADKQIAFMIVGAFGLVIAFALSGNPRLFSLWCLMLSAPLGIKKVFLANPHMGGASGVTIDGCDLFLGILLLFILRDAVLHRRRLRFARPVVICWGAMIGLGLLDVLLGPMRALPILEIVRMAKCYLLFFVIINEVVRARQFLHVIVAICCGIVMQCVITDIQWFFKANLHLQFLGEPAAVATTAATKGVYLGTVDIYRAGGLFEHPNLLAGYLAMLLPICIALLFSRVGPLAKAALAGVVVLGMVALVITLSRSGWISFAAGFGVLFLFSMLHQKLRLR